MSTLNLSEQLETAAEDERRKAVRALLRNPFVSAAGAGAEAYTLIRRHRDSLAEWFQNELGYRLVVDSDFARLMKAPLPRPLVLRRLESRNGQPFDPRRYVLLCLALAVLDQAGDQTTLGRLAEDVKLLASELPDFLLDFDVPVDRRAFMHAVRAIVDLGILELRDGDEERFARGDQGGDALYQIHHRRLAHVLAAPVPPSSVEQPERFTVEAYPDTSEGRARRSRHRLMRVLVEEAICYFEDLEPEDLAYLTTQRPRLLRHLERVCGLDAEVRAEGIVTIDVQGDVTDLTFPAEGTVAHVALLLAEELARRGREGTPMTHSEVQAHVGALAERYGRYWRADLTADALGHQQLADLAIERLAAFGLLRRIEGGVVARPAIARFVTVGKPQGEDVMP